MENDFDFDFEFGCITPTSPFSDPTESISPADQFFLNGRLLPHSFPIHSTKSPSIEPQSRSNSSRSGNSLISSRSNSARSSTSGTTPCSSARTSASDASERKAFEKKQLISPASLVSRRWQLISPAPVLAPGVWKRRRLQSCETKKKRRDVSGEELGFCQRVLRSFVMSCRACHALEVDEFGSRFELK